MNEFNKILRQLRKSKGYLQKDIADALDISAASYSLYEKGQREPKYDLLKKIADFYNVSLDYLLTGRAVPSAGTKTLYQTFPDISEIPGSITLDITQDNYQNYKNYFDIIFKDVVEQVFTNPGVFYSSSTGERLSEAAFKERLYTLDDDHRFAFFQSILSKIIINPALDTLTAVYRKDLSNS